jgi:hypothetical protein
MPTDEREKVEVLETRSTAGKKFYDAFATWSGV